MEFTVTYGSHVNLTVCSQISEAYLKLSKPIIFELFRSFSDFCYKDDKYQPAITHLSISCINIKGWKNHSLQSHLLKYSQSL